MDSDEAAAVDTGELLLADGALLLVKPNGARCVTVAGAARTDAGDIRTCADDMPDDVDGDGDGGETMALETARCRLATSSPMAANLPSRREIW